MNALHEMLVPISVAARSRRLKDGTRRDTRSGVDSDKSNGGRCSEVPSAQCPSSLTW